MTSATRHPTALIVDDDVIPRRMMAFHLQAAGFDCSYAINGNDALSQIVEREFDLVVTDLIMPERHGHSLAVELLRRTSRPIIAVHTGVEDPRIVEDLITRGVDDVVLKPANYTAFAGKMKGLVARRNANRPTTERTRPSRSNTNVRRDTSQKSERCETVSLAQLEDDLREAPHLLPISHDALELVALLAQDDKTGFPRIVQIIEREASLCCEVIKVANRAACAAGRRMILDAEGAVSVIGTRRLGEIAIGISALRTLTDTILPWLDVETARIQGIAAQIALSHLCLLNHRDPFENGSVLSAIVHPMGRVLLGTLYPQQYQEMVEACAVDGVTLSEIERSVFPVSHTAALAELLSNWGVPPEGFYPLKYVADPFSSLCRLPQSVRGQVETLKVAIAVGQCASGQSHPWETIELPERPVLNRLNIDSASKLIESVRESLAAVEPSNAVARSVVGH